MDTGGRSYVARWAAGGALLGMVFPLVGIAVGRLRSGGFDLLEIHADQPVLWALDLAPLLLAAIGALIGAAHTHLSELRAKTDRIAEQMAEELSTEIHDHNVELARSADLQAKYFAALSHDMRTPLSAILGFAAVAADDGVTDVGTVLAYMQEIGAAARQLLEIVNDLLDTAKLGSGKIELQVGDVDGDQVADAVVRHLTPLAEEEGLILFTDFQAAGAVCRADELRLRQILVNLVSNALKYTEEGSVLVRSYVTPDAVIYEVEDTGVGIAPQDFALLFRPFEQTAAGRVRLDSTGLGLPVSLGLAQAMGGDIEVESDGVGRGSVFRLRLPPGGTGAEAELCLATLPALAA